MSALGKLLIHNSSLPRCKREDVGYLIANFFKKGNDLENYVLNDGCVNLILQSPTISAVVVCWGGDLNQYGHNHACEQVWTYVVKGSVSCKVNSRGDNARRDSAEVVSEGSGHFIEDSDEIKSHYFFGGSKSVSVHVYNTEAMNICTHPIKCNCTVNAQIVICNDTLSVTDAERGRSVAKICEDNAMQASNICTKSLRLFTNFRDLIELLHHEIESIADGEYHSPEHVKKISSLLGAVRLNEAEYKRYLRFKDNSYTRNLVGYDVPADGNHKAKFTVLLLCWAKNQMSPIHDHAGSSCFVKVLKGRIREVRYDASTSPPTIKRDLTLGAQEVCYINDTQGVHAMGNPDPDQVAVSLHIYAPPYVLCTLFDEQTGAKRVGSMATATIPSNPFTFVDVPNGDKAGCRKLQLGEFYSLVSTSLKENRTDSIGELVERLALKENEWKEFVHFTPCGDSGDRHCYTRSLVSLDSDFSLMVISWNNDQCSPIHEHGPTVKSWVKVLSGTLVLKRYDDDSQLIDEKVYNEGTNIDTSMFSGKHILGNASSDEPAVSLHLFSPPFVTMGYIDSTGVSRVIPVVHSAHSTGRCCAADPISHTDEVISKTRGCSFDETKSEGSADSLHTLDELQKTTLSDLLSFFQQEQDKHIFTNLNALIRFISIRDLANHPSSRQVVCALDRMILNPEEWGQLIDDDHTYSPSANLIARGKGFKLEICRWDPSRRSKREVSPNVFWLKVLDGEIMVTQYLDGEQIHSGIISKKSCTFIGNKLECSFRNLSKTAPCVALKLSRD